MRNRRENPTGRKSVVIEPKRSFRENRSILEKHSDKTVFCLVQFKDTTAIELPRMYLATPAEIGQWLKLAAKGRGDTILYEKHVWTRKAKASGTIDTIPHHRIFTEERLEEMAQTVEPGQKTEPHRYE